MMRALIAGTPTVKDFLQSLSTRTEFTLVLGIAFGWACLMSMLVVLNGFPADASVFDDLALYSTILMEIVVLLLLGLLLQQRGWRLDDFHLRPSLRGSLQGVMLAALCLLIYFLLANLVNAVLPNAFDASNQSVVISPSLSLAPIILVSLINPLFEELFVTAYVVNMLQQRRGFWFAVNTSTAIRLAYHLYQGMPGVLLIIPMGLLFAAFYARQRSLWPLLVAHALWDFLPLTMGR